MDHLIDNIGEKEFSRIWTADMGDGTFRNPLIYADYSDPDVIRVGEDFFMTASSFNCSPALPLLHSKDLINWRLVNHVVDRLPYSVYDRPQYGKGVWAPSIRYHNHKFWVFFPMPDEGIFMSSTMDPFGKWSDPVLVKSARGWIDPCPFWDDDGKAYLVHAFARSRTGFGSILNVCRMKPDGTGLLDDGTTVFDGNQNEHRTIEGPKFYKRNSYYYIFAPAGGVGKGWQTILRSRSIFGPYEAKIALHQGNTTVNGPHQGGLIELENGENWFMHFQDRDEYGRILHLQPVVWENDWPVIGTDTDGDGIGEPVLRSRKPSVGKVYPVAVPETSDDFHSEKLGLQWQWNANYREDWYSTTARPGYLRLYASNDLLWGGKTLWHAPNLLLQKYPAPGFTATARLEFCPARAEERAGLVISGDECYSLAVHRDKKGMRLGCFKAYEKNGGRVEEELDGCSISASEILLRVTVRPGAVCSFSYSQDGELFIDIGKPFKATKTLWMGSKVGIFCLNLNEEDSSGYADFDWFVIKEKEDTEVTE